MRDWRVRVLSALLLAHALPAGALGKTEVDLEFDAYYSALGLTLPFRDEEVDKAGEKSETDTYSELLSQGLVPRFMVLEVSVNPMPLAGLAIRHYGEDTYNHAKVTPNLNLVQALTAGFEEPYAFAMLLGNVVDFAEGKKSLGRSRKGYVGFLLGAGNFHIVNNKAVRDDWLEAEWKVKGDQKTDNRKMSWSFRGGRKLHSNGGILDSYYLGIRRSRTDFKKNRYSFLLSSAVEYRFDFDFNGTGAIGHYLMIEKNFPVPKKKWTFSLGVGYLWRGANKYTGDLANKQSPIRSQVLLRPNLRF